MLSMSFQHNMNCDAFEQRKTIAIKNYTDAVVFTKQSTINVFSIHVNAKYHA